jgi:hypothetical protein
MSRITVIAALAVVVAGTTGPALAQGTGCGDIQKTLAERKELVAKANASSNTKKGSKMTAAEACGLFGKLVSNGSSGLKWIDANKEWCSIPESFAQGFKADHAKVTALRTKICSIASQQAVMEKRARQQAEAGGGGGGLLGGPGLTGSYKVPQGAL